MKKLFLLCMIALLVVSCDKEKEEERGYLWDFYNYCVDIEVKDAVSGANLLNPEVDGNILNQEITLLYKDEVYPMVLWKDATDIYQTRMTYAHFYGLRYFNEKGCFQLIVGEFKTGGTVDVPFTIDWGDGTQTHFVVTADVKKANTANPEIIRSLTVDGVPVAHESGRDWHVVLTR